MTIIRKNISLGDPTYFCNKSWTLSYHVNAKAWISFHSYLPNWYIGDNNFFYSGLNGCCDDIDFLVGIVESVIDCDFEGTATEVDCYFAGIATDITDCRLEGFADDITPTTTTSTTTTTSSTTTTTTTIA